MLLPTNIVVELTTTLSPTARLAVLIVLRVVMFPDTLAVPVIVSVASGDELFIPTRFKSPSATIKLVLTTKPFLTTKSFSAIYGSLSPVGYFLLFILF